MASVSSHHNSDEGTVASVAVSKAIRAAAIRMLAMPVVDVCPECHNTTLYYGGTECASCGWHKPGCTMMHANFERYINCKWCVL